MKPIIALLILTIIFFSKADCKSGFRTGNDILVTDKSELIKNQNIAVITNKTGVNQNGIHIIDLLLNNGFIIKKIFTPEHGFNADDDNSSYKDIPVISLYGNNTTFNDKQVSDIDVIVYDIQDLGVRFYTYTSTLYLNMIAAKNAGKRFIVCDRPSIANQDYFGGPMLDVNFSSFVGKIPTPVLYGMTIGELAQYLNSEYVHNDNFEVIKMQGYDRHTLYESVINFWINPSPSIFNLETAKLYPALCFLEGTNVSEGRGTDTPFQIFGTPDMNANDIINELKGLNIQGVNFEKSSFVPSQDKLPTYTAMKFTGINCEGVKVSITNFKIFKPFECSVGILYALNKKYNGFQWTGKNFIDKLAGTDNLRRMINDGNTYNEIIEFMNRENEIFKIWRSKYLMYE